MSPESSAWRILSDEGQRDPIRNLALDEAIARTAVVPTIRFWRNDPCAVIGRFQLLAAEIDLPRAEELGVPVVRRFTGGGAVYHDPGNLNVSIVAPRGAPASDGVGVRGPLDLYPLVLRPIELALRDFGFAVERTDRDLRIGGRKVSGVAAWIGSRSMLVHSTLLVDADLERLALVLDGPGAPGDPRWERTRSRRMAVTSLARERAPGVLPGGDVVARRIALAAGAAAWLPESPSDAEQAAAARLLADRYLRAGWHATGTP